MAIVAGASSGIGPGITRALLERGYRGVANSRTIGKSKELKASADLVLVDGDISKKDRTEEFAEHASVADGASNLFVQIFGPEAGHVRLVYGVQSLPVGAPVIVDVIFEIEPARESTAK